MTWSNLILEDRSILHTMQNFGAAQWIAVLAGVLVLTSFVQGLFILRANGATRQVALAAQKAADFLKLVERPYVSEHIAESTGIQIQFRAGPDEGRDSPKPDDGRTADLPPLSIVFKNYGRTPATLKHWGGSLTIEAAVPKAVLDDRQFTMRVLAPKDEVTSEISSSLTISPEQRKKLENGRLQIWLSGYVEFKDIFGAQTRREFAWSFDRTTQRFTPEYFRVTSET